MSAAFTSLSLAAAAGAGSIGLMQEQSVTARADGLGNERLIGSWVASAACRGEAKGFTIYPASAAEVERVIRTCEACPVQRQCLAYSARHDVEGVWAGRWHTAGRKSAALRARGPSTGR